VFFAIDSLSVLETSKSNSVEFMAKDTTASVSEGFEPSLNFLMLKFPS
jgi:hypothetical protein